MQQWMRKQQFCSFERTEEAKVKKGFRKKLRDEKGGVLLVRVRTGFVFRSGTARFVGGGRREGSFPVRPGLMRSSALQAHEGHHLLQFEGQPLFSGRVVLLQRAHDLLGVFAHVGVDLTERAHAVELAHVHP